MSLGFPKLMFVNKFPRVCTHANGRINFSCTKKLEESGTFQKGQQNIL
jgi:hypothetical protein